jgi:curved DNA-binding protein CbpA
MSTPSPASLLALARSHLSSSRSFYSILRLPPSCTPAELRASFRALSLALHPDRQRAGGPCTAAAFAELKAAYDHLAEPGLRAAYDEALAGAAPRAVRAPVVRLSEMRRERVLVADEDGGGGGEEEAFSRACRCGEVFEVLGSEVGGGVVLDCGGCGLKLRGEE